MSCIDFTETRFKLPDCTCTKPGVLLKIEFWGFKFAIIYNKSKENMTYAITMITETGLLVLVYCHNIVTKGGLGAVSIGQNSYGHFIDWMSPLCHF